jgi:hypothetical protein
MAGSGIRSSAAFYADSLKTLVGLTVATRHRAGQVTHLAVI